MAIDFSKLKAKLDVLDGKKSGGKNNNVFWKPEVGTHMIRILPDPDGDPVKELHFHYNVDKGGVMCPKRNFGDACPICEFATSLSVSEPPIARIMQRSCLLRNASTHLRLSVVRRRTVFVCGPFQRQLTKPSSRLSSMRTTVM